MKYQKLYSSVFSLKSCHIKIYATPITIAPNKTYCLRRPHLDFVLSDIKPMIGSVIESNILGKK